MSQNRNNATLAKELQDSISLRLLTGMAALRDGTLAGEQVFLFSKVLGYITTTMYGIVGANIRNDHAVCYEAFRKACAGRSFQDPTPIVLEPEIIDKLNRLVGTFDKLLIERRITPNDIFEAAVKVDKLLQKHFAEAKKELGLV